MKKNKRAGTSGRRVAQIAAILSVMSAGTFVVTLGKAQAADTPVSSPSLAPEVSEPVDVEIFQGVQLLSTPSGSYYPYSESHNGREGWVTLNLMVDPKGEPYEVMVLESSGNPAFEKAALQAVRTVKFLPARRGETPIDSSFMFKLKFTMGKPAKGASYRFVGNYRTLTKAIAAGDKVTADMQLAQLEGENLYEEAFEHYGRYLYFAKWGTPAQQLAGHPVPQSIQPRREERCGQ